MLNKEPTWRKWIVALLAILAVIVVMLLARPSASQVPYLDASGETVAAETDTSLTLARALIVLEGEIEKRDYRIEQLEKQVNELKPSGLAKFWSDNKFIVGAVIGGWLVSRVR